MDLKLDVAHRRVAPDHVTEFGAFQQAYADSAGVRSVEYGRYVAVLVRLSDGWRMDRFFGFSDSTVKVGGTRPEERAKGKRGIWRHSAPSAMLVFRPQLSREIRSWSSFRASERSSSPPPCSPPHAPSSAQASAAPEMLLRLDDIGMNHSVNLAIEQVAKTGMPISVSVLFACPWYQEAVEILKKYPNVTVGVHLALNSEWRGYRWGPVLGKAGAPSLVDSAGYFHPSVPAFLQSKYDLGEVERELTAQMERAIKSGLKIAYVDPHMGSALATPQLREVTERVARKYGVGISG